MAKKRKSPNQKATEQQIIRALTRHCGLVSRAAKSLGLSRKAIYLRAAASEVIADAITEARELLKDDAESQLVKNIKAGDQRAIEFYLRTQARDRGYVEKSEQQISGGLELGGAIGIVEAADWYGNADRLPAPPAAPSAPDAAE